MGRRMLVLVAAVDVTPHPTSTAGARWVADPP